MTDGSADRLSGAGRGRPRLRVAHDDDVPVSERGRYTQLPDDPGPEQAFITVDVAGRPPEPGNEGTEREWVARYGAAG